MIQTTFSITALNDEEFCEAAELRCPRELKPEIAVFFEMLQLRMLSRISE